jgi:hypothetical protein
MPACGEAYPEGVRRSSVTVGVPLLVTLAVAWSGCSGAKDSLGSGGKGDGGASSSSGGGSGGSSGAGSSGGGSGSSSGGASSSGAGSSGGGSSGGHPEGGSCPPCDPGNVNLPGGTCDLDCSGSPAPPAPCDAALAVGGPAGDFAKALGLCQMATGDSWGLVSATYTQGYDSSVSPAAGQHSILPGFGPAVHPLEGKQLGVLSTGYAYTCDDASQTATCTGAGTADPYFKGGQTAMTGTGTGAAPPGYPKATTGCLVGNAVYDVAGVTLQVRVPKNAQALSFDFDFYSSEWPEYVCSEFNDSFVAWLGSEAWTGTGAGGDLNLAFDSTGSPISVNSPFISRCTAGTQTGCAGTVTGSASCVAGPGDLQGTGFYNLGTYCVTQSTGGGSTGWLTASGPVHGGETITLQLMIWDTGDPNWDSSVLVDDLKWYGALRPAGTVAAQ